MFYSKISVQNEQHPLLRVTHRTYCEKFSLNFLDRNALKQKTETETWFLDRNIAHLHCGVEEEITITVS